LTDLTANRTTAHANVCNGGRTSANAKLSAGIFQLAESLLRLYSSSMARSLQVVVQNCHRGKWDLTSLAKDCFAAIIVGTTARLATAATP
jgi:hypothetical protein